MLKPCLTCQKPCEPSDFNPKSPLYCVVCVPVVSRKSRAAASMVTVDFEVEYKKLLTILHRDVEKLMETSFDRSLHRDESNTLIAYLKQVAELRQMKKIEDEIKENPDV